MSLNIELVITGTNSITAVGHDADMTADSVFSGISSGISFDDFRDDQVGGPIKTAVIECIDDEDKGSDETDHMFRIASKCLIDLCRRYFETSPKVEDLFLFLGFPSRHRPGPCFENEGLKLLTRLEIELKPYTENVHCEFFSTGNASAFHGVQKAEETLAKYPQSVCLVGGLDSLLSIETLSWFEKDWRLVSETRGREQGLFPSQAAGFFIVETKKPMADQKKRVLARIIGHSMTQEPAPFVSEYPCMGDGLTNAIRKALQEKNTPPKAIDSIFCDLNGEYHRFKEWGFAGTRCFPDNDHSPWLVHPADCLGDVGAAWLPVLAGIASEGFKRDTVGEHVMIFCSDDHGERGVMILKKP